MTINAMTLSGWGQSADSLSGLVVGSEALDYIPHADAARALTAIGAAGQGRDIVIGWSLGGQMAVRAIAAGMLAPRKLVLIATPFQFVARAEHKIGMPRDLYAAFRQNYAADPESTLAMAWASIVKGDSRAAAIRRQLERQDKKALLRQNWLVWLDILESFSCDGLPMASFPPTLLIHGREDAVVYHEQSEAFARAIPHAQLRTLEGCGHAPHWHDPAWVQQAIMDFAHV